MSSIAPLSLGLHLVLALSHMVDRRVIPVPATRRAGRAVRVRESSRIWSGNTAGCCDSALVRQFEVLVMLSFSGVDQPVFDIPESVGSETCVGSVPSPSVPPIRVVIADNVPLVRSGLRNALAKHSDIVVVAEASNGDEAVRCALRHHPDVVLMDVFMPVLDGLGATRLICADSGDPPVKVLILSIHEGDDLVFDALRSGASGFVLKDSLPDEVVAAVRTVAAGESILSPRLTSKLVRDVAARPLQSRQHATVDLLTQRERDVLQLIAAGLHNNEIARILVVSETTVKTHVQRLYRKLSLRDRVHAVIFAYQNGLALPPKHSPSTE